MKRFWYCFCLLFLINNINILIEESYQVVYKMVNPTKSIRYLICLNLKEILINKTSINLKVIKLDINSNLRWIQENKKSRNGELISINTVDKIENEIKLIDYLIYQNRICFIFDKSTDLMSFFYLLNKFPINITYFVFNNGNLEKNLNLLILLFHAIQKAKTRIN